MTREDAVSITSRLVALYFACWTAVSLSFLPSSLMAYWSMREYSVRNVGLVPGSGHNEWMQMVSLVLNLVRIAIGAALATWFYKGSSGVRNFFIPAASSQPAESQS
jgi:hypothetical protein